MPRGAAVVPYRGKRGTTWNIKFTDAAGVQVWERLGSEKDGWTEAKAKKELRQRLVDVERDGLRRAKPVNFRTFVEGWLAVYPHKQGLKRSTADGYGWLARKHLIPAFGHLRIGDLTVARLELYMAEKRRGGQGPASVNRHLNLLSLLCKSAVAQGLLRSNPVALVDRPKEPRRRWKILTPVEVARVNRAFAELVESASRRETLTALVAHHRDEEALWIEQARVVFLTVVGVGLRRGEVLGLRWRDVELANPDGATLRVRETWSRGHIDTPKSESSERTVSLGPVVAEELWKHRGRTNYAGDGERVFVSVHKGTPLDVHRYALTFRAALARAKVEGYVRPFHDGRHTAITNDAASGSAPLAIMQRAGHASFKTTQLYIDLAGVQFRDEAVAAELRLLGPLATSD